MFYCFPLRRNFVFEGFLFCFCFLWVFFFLFLFWGCFFLLVFLVCFSFVLFCVQEKRDIKRGQEVTLINSGFHKFKFGRISSPFNPVSTNTWFNSSLRSSPTLRTPILQDFPKTKKITELQIKSSNAWRNKQRKQLNRNWIPWFECNTNLWRRKWR